jgi:hypothetical protein
MRAPGLIRAGLVCFVVLLVGVVLGAASVFAATLPTIGGVSFSGIGSSDATVAAEVDPQGLATIYRVQYGTSEAYGSETPAAALPAGEEGVGVSVRLDGLVPDSEYHFRVVAVNEDGTEVGADVTFRTLPTGIQGLPDGRVFEMVTPVENQDAEVYAPYAFATTRFYENHWEYGLPTRLPFQAAADGDAIAFVAEPTSPGGNGEHGLSKGDDYLATRSMDGGWKQRNLSPMGYDEYEKDQYWAFSSDLSTGILTAQSSESLPPLTPGAPGEKDSVLYTHSTAGGPYSPLFTTTPPDESGIGFGTFNGFTPVALRYAGASADLSRLLFEANDALSPEAINGGSDENNLYVSDAGSLRAVNVLPGATASEPNAVFGGPVFNPGEGESRAAPDFSHVISADGSRIFWTDLNVGPDEDRLFVRENGASTVAVSEGAARFWSATPDGRYVLYSEGEQLLRFDVDSQTREVLAGSGAEVQGVLGTSEDGDYVYFAADGGLAPGAQAGQPNLYLLHNGGGGWEAPRFIATLQPGDGAGLDLGRNGEIYGEGGSGDWEPGLANRTAEVTPDGQGLVFMSRGSIPAVGFSHGYENEGLGEVYSYQAGEGGEPPQPNFETKRDSQGSPGEGVAAFLPVEFQATYQPRWISEDGGRVFFDSAEPLVAQDTNGQQDAYEWERDGEGSCSRPDGCVYLLTGGTTSSASWFIDASANGNDAFVVSRAQLVPQDQNENYDLYDARVGGVNVLSAPAGCTGGGCQGAAPTSSESGVPASATFAGPGNLAPPLTAGGTAPVKPRAKPLTRAQKLTRALRACMGAPKRRRAVCERQARARYGPKVKVKKAGMGKHSSRGARS